MKILLITLFSFFALPANVFAQQDSVIVDSLSGKNHSLKEVTVKGSKIIFRSFSATPAQVFGGRELERINSLSVADAVRYFSGVQIKDYGGVGGLKTINVRSMGSNHTAVYYDGVKLGNAQNGQVDLGKYSLDNIEQIELFSAQKNTIFLPARGFSSASALYLEAKRPSFENGKSDNVGVTFRSGSFGLVNPSFLWEHKISNKVSGSVSAEWKKATGKYKFRYTNGVYDTTAVRANGDINSLRIEAGLNGLLRDSSNWDLKVYSYQSENGLPGAIVNGVFKSYQRQWDQNFFVQSSYKNENLEKYSIMLKAKYAYDFTRFQDPSIIKDSGILDNRFTQQELYLSIANKYEINRIWDIALNSDFEFSTLDANLYRFSYPTRYTTLTALATDLHLRKLNVQASLLATIVSDKVKLNSGAGNKKEFTPALSASWQVFNNKELLLRGHYKRIFRMPTFNDLYYTYVGNTTLKPEYTNQYNFGIVYNKEIDHKGLKNISIQTDVYYNEVEDKIIAQPGENLLRWVMSNLDDVSIRGIETNIQTGFLVNEAIRLNTGLTYTYQQAKDALPTSENFGNQIPYTPIHSGSFLASAAWKAYSLNYSYIYTGERYTQRANTIDNYLQPWYTHDLSFSWENKYKKAGVRLIAEVNNLFNQYYDVIANFPMPGRSFRLTARVSLNK